MLKNNISPGNIGVFLSDTRIPARLFMLTDNSIDMGLGVFMPLDDRINKIIGELSDFWVLLDQL